MMHSSTIAGSIPARATASRTTMGAELSGLEVFQRAEKFAGRGSCG